MKVLIHARQVPGNTVIVHRYSLHPHHGLVTAVV
jgi:hypothetical protein